MACELLASYSQVGQNESVGVCGESFQYEMVTPDPSHLHIRHSYAKINHDCVTLRFHSCLKVASGR